MFGGGAVGAERSLAHQIVLGTSFLHDCGVVHGDLHAGNIAFGTPCFDGTSEERMISVSRSPHCSPVIIKGDQRLTDSLPKYLVPPANLERFVKRDDLRIKIIDLGHAFFGTEAPEDLQAPLIVLAPEAIFNLLSAILKIEIGTQVDVWSVGCLIYELVTSDFVVEDAHNDESALRELSTFFGPLPKEWVGSLGASYTTGSPATYLEQMILSESEVDDTPGVAALLQQILVIDPFRRPSVSDLLNHPWLVGSSDPAVPPGPTSE